MKRPEKPSPALQREIAVFMARNQLKQILPRFESHDLYRRCKVFPAIQVYTGLEPWPLLWYAVLFDGNKTTGIFTYATSKEELHSQIPTNFFVRSAKKKTDPEHLVEVWI